MAENAPQPASDLYSSRISETSRIIGFGLLAAFYGIKVDTSNALKADPCLVLVLGASAAITVLLDYLQYVFGYLMARAALRTSVEFYDKGWPRFWFGLKTIAFVAKQVTAIVGAATLITMVLSV